MTCSQVGCACDCHREPGLEVGYAAAFFGPFLAGQPALAGQVVWVISAEHRDRDADWTCTVLWPYKDDAQRGLRQVPPAVLRRATREEADAWRWADRDGRSQMTTFSARSPRIERFEDVLIVGENPVL